MWAQGLTVGTLISSALIAGVTTTDNKVVEGKIDHSWADILGKSIFPISMTRGQQLISVEQEGQMKKSDLDRIRGTVEKSRG
jgi:hypothetical protein